LLIVLVSIFCSLASRLHEAGSTPAGVDSIIDANNSFALDLYSQLRKESGDENIFFSPYSILVALTMTYEGARGKTAEEMQSVLHIPSDPDLRRSNFARIINGINRKEKKFKLSTANALWTQKDYKFLKEYLTTVERYYGGRATNLDFVKETEKSRQKINRWVEDQTEKRIKDLIPRGVLTPLTRLVLTNAIYFKGTWVKQFDKKETSDEEFRTISRRTVKVPMMRLTGEGARFNYAEVDSVQILELAYDGEDLSMLILLPKEDKFEDLEKLLTSERLSEWRSMLREQRVDVYIPRFKFDTKYSLAKDLIAMGMPSAFGVPPADFSGMDGTRNLFISEVIHQAFVDVNEEGTEAAAATGVVMVLSSVKMTPVFRADRPFIFMIQQRKTGNILFLGMVGDPV
ncbi:MAG TPA: serpin family protein, partial [bacterium (Candidatus Stahlbacteria)]|nr:serpin family protein [Candidatus Stahlbacteria bacterium]